jgi:hypothetical protein
MRQYMGMKTSNFAKSSKDPKAVAISRGLPRWYKGRTFEPLAPTREMLSMNEEDFFKAYTERISQLNLKEVVRELGDDAVLLCWEGFNVRCHRRLVAEIFEQAFGIVIPEVGHERSESIPFADQKRKEKPAKRTPQFSFCF